MPSAPSLVTGNYPTCEDVMNFARAAGNDMLQSTSGAILTDGAPFTLSYLNAAIEQVAKELANNGCPQTIIDNELLAPLTPVPNPDPSIQTFISQDGYFDGLVMHKVPFLPPNMILPLDVWERQVNSGQQFQLMRQPQGGLPSCPQTQWLGQWEWRQGQINFVGSLSSEEIRVRYLGSLPKVGNTADFSKTVIQVQGGTRALGYWVLTFFAEARGSAMAQIARQHAEETTEQLVIEFVRAQQRIAYRPRGYRDGSDRLDNAVVWGGNR